MSGKRAIEKLVHRLEERSHELQQVLATNAALRLRGAAVDVLMRVQDEVMQIRVRLGLAPTVAYGGFSHEHLIDSGSGRCCGASGGDGSGGSEVLPPDIHGWLLQHLPWLARGLDMADASLEVARSFERMDVSAARTAWQGLVKALMQATGPTEEAFAAARRICQFWTSMVVFNPLLFMEFQGAQLLTGQPATGSGDAPRQHWEGVLRAIKLTKLQAMVAVEIQKCYCEQVERISAERSELVNLIEAEMAAAASLGGAAGLCEAPSLALMDSMQGTVRRHQAMLMVASLSYRALLTTQQFGQMMALSFPYPCNSQWMCGILARLLAQEPEVFHPADGPQP